MWTKKIVNRAIANTPMRSSLNFKFERRLAWPIRLTKIIGRLCVEFVDSGGGKESPLGLLSYKKVDEVGSPEDELINESFTYKVGPKVLVGNGYFGNDS